MHFCQNYPQSSLNALMEMDSRYINSTRFTFAVIGAQNHKEALAMLAPGNRA